MQVRFIPLPKEGGYGYTHMSGYLSSSQLGPQQDLSYTHHYMLWVRKTGKKLEEGLEHPFPLLQMNAPTDDVHMLLLCSESPGLSGDTGTALAEIVERFVSVCAVSWHSGHGLPIPWLLNFDRIGWKLSSWEEDAGFCPEMTLWALQTKKARVPAPDAMLKFQRNTYYFLLSISASFIMGILKSIWSCWHTKSCTDRQTDMHPQVFYLKVAVWTSALPVAATIITNGNSTEEAPTTSTLQKGLFLTGQCFGGQTTGGGENAVAQVLTEKRWWLAFKREVKISLKWELWENWGWYKFCDSVPLWKNETDRREGGHENIAD